MSKEETKSVDPLSLIRPKIRDIKAYSIDHSPAPVILDANESPFTPPRKILERMLVVMAGTPMNRYPDMEAMALRAAIAHKDGAAPEEVLLGNGSDELIFCLILAMMEPGERILVPTPTFVMYETIAKSLNMEPVTVPLAENWELDLEATLRMIKEQNPRLIFLATPNNPTGRRYPVEAIEAVAEAAPGAVVVDEAYIDFSAGGSYGLLYKSRPNVIIMRTLSKIGLAALRLGYILADKAVIENVNKVRLPYNINSMTQAAAAEALRNWDQFIPLFTKVRQERDKLFAALNEISGIHAWPSEANFILMRVEDGAAERVFNALLEHGVRVRWFAGNPRVGDCFRVTVGDPHENSMFLAALKEAL
ncbi:MAG: histidinol-phosphate transaminase [Nitrospinota bacterium]|nr:histidinol-phosphate transaminase [Nitrospinota bacterium]